MNPFSAKSDTNNAPGSSNHFTSYKFRVTPQYRRKQQEHSNVPCEPHSARPTSTVPVNGPQISVELHNCDGSIRVSTNLK